MRILVTRPAAAAAALASALRARGHDVLIESLLTIHPKSDAPVLLASALTGAQAVLFTSVNGVEAFAAANPRRDLRVFAVGDATATAARRLGFQRVESAGGDVTDLASLVRARLTPGAGTLVHGAGEKAAGDLAGELRAAGYSVGRVALYRAEPAPALSESTLAAFRDRRIDAALFFSPRTASTFVRLAAAAGVEAACADMAAVALSPAVSAALGAVPWRRVVVAREPTEAALLDALDRLAEVPAHEGQDG